MLKVQMHRTRHKISDLAGWSEWSKWEEGLGKTDDPTFEIEIDNRVFFTGPDMTKAPADVVALVIAAREFWDIHNDLSEESRALDKALEAFGERVPYENEPEDPTTSTIGGDHG